MAKHAAMKLGRQPVKHDPRTFKMSSYIDFTKLPPVPDEVDWGSKVPDWQVMGNKDYGDCTFASAAHCVMAWATSHDNAYAVPDQSVVDAYLAFTGGQDNGCIELDVLNHWRKDGILDHKIDAYLSFNPLNPLFVKLAIYLFGAAYVGVGLPLTAQTQDVWTVVDDHGSGEAEPNSWGGHAIPLVAYTKEGPVCVTWGKLQRMTWEWWAKYAAPSAGGEAYAVLSPDWVGEGIVAPNTFAYTQLQADLNAL
jgi:hypothetical protein